jgi:transposase
MKKITKTNKAETVKTLLRRGLSTKDITDHMAVSPGYVWLLKKQMAEEKAKPEPTPEPAPVVDKPEQIEKILNKRAEQYGTFMRNADIAIKLKQVIHNAMVREDTQLYPDQLQALDMIVTKIGRILTGNPSHLDSWIDIAGYAKLVSDRLQGNAR